MGNGAAHLSVSHTGLLGGSNEVPDKMASPSLLSLMRVCLSSPSYSIWSTGCHNRDLLSYAIETVDGELLKFVALGPLLTSAHACLR